MSPVADWFPSTSELSYVLADAIEQTGARSAHTNSRLDIDYEDGLANYGSAGAPTTMVVRSVHAADGQVDVFDITITRRPRA